MFSMRKGISRVKSRGYRHGSKRLRKLRVDATTPRGVVRQEPYLSSVNIHSSRALQSQRNLRIIARQTDNSIKVGIYAIKNCGPSKE